MATINNSVGIVHNGRDAGVNPLATFRRTLIPDRTTCSGRIVSTVHGRATIKLNNGRTITALGTGRPGEQAIVVDGRIVATMPSSGPVFAVAV